jgi:NodT family efflux transporter outer membrane factor (OMF) lipoprotein
MSLKTPLALVALVALGACAPTGLPPASVALPPAYPTAGTASAAGLERWWTLFDDAQMSGMIEDALARAPDARAALATLDEARATRQQALLRYDVQGNLSGQAGTGQTRVNGATVKSDTEAGAFSPSWEVDLFGRRAAASTAARATLEAATFTYYAARQSLAANVASNLIEARGLAVQLRDAREALTIAAGLADVGVAKVKAGIGARVDLDSLEASRASAQANVDALQAQLSVSRRSLLVLIGQGTAPLDSVNIEPALRAPPAMPADAPATLLVRRPDIRRTEAQMRAAIGTLRLDSLALLPTFSLLPSTSGTRTTLGPATTTLLWSMAGGVSLPLFDRAKLLAETRAQRARALQAVIAYEKTVQTGYGEAEKALATYAADQTRLAALAQAEALSHRAFEAQSAGYRAGVVDLTTLLQAQQTWRTNRTALSSLRATALSDAVNCFRALGGGWSAADPLPSSFQSSPRP